MKLTSLLAQYLYTNHRLDLPGIGTFILDPSTISSLDDSKQRSTVLEGVSFENNPSLKESPDLIRFISSQTGKMKALADADLESHVQLAKQFLNIGKPFTFDGIGTLVKKKPGEYEFSPLSVSVDKIKEYKTKDSSPVTLEESASKEYESFLSTPKSSIGWRRPVIAVLILSGIALAIWGGYTISRNVASNDSTDIEDSTGVTETIPAVDSTTIKDSVKEPPQYKYVLQISPRQTALRRYEQLKTNLWDVKMETDDSVRYKLFLLLPAANADTSRVLDSLMVLSGKRVYIEHTN